ncbi:hypothetical protein IWQ49_000704 [Labrenzia sp. EL_126]|nr:hypothetical protein [Labrenzia sp. EL_126]
MQANIDEIIRILEVEWDVDGFFYNVRNGRFDPVKGQEIVAILQNIDPGKGKLLPKRLVSLLWYMPVFLDFQDDRVNEQGNDTAEYEKFRNQIVCALENVLGMP